MAASDQSESASAGWQDAAASRCVSRSGGGGADVAGGGCRPRGQEQCELHRRPAWSDCKILGGTEPANSLVWNLGVFALGVVKRTAENRAGGNASQRIAVSGCV